MVYTFFANFISVVLLAIKKNMACKMYQNVNDKL